MSSHQLQCAGSFVLSSSDNYHLGLYGGRQWGDLGFRTGATYTWHRVLISRSVAFAGFADSPRRL
ncbi:MULTISPECIES: autotransporter domain-containing protein [unclassified Nitrobacter]|uniref:autotransporter domain-containing protein n=1 Tax=unclassified Nitrobacter TaxID=2620411 RepID=UPI0025F96F80|nr:MULTISPECIES: autotransporter domain-containing protein [unclassified Nitrobacter]